MNPNGRPAQVAFDVQNQLLHQLTRYEPFLSSTREGDPFRKSFLGVKFQIQVKLTNIRNTILLRSTQVGDPLR